MLEALESGTSSESESDSPVESHSKDSSDSTLTSPVKTNPIESSTSEVSNSSSDVPLSKLLVHNLSTKRSGTLSELNGSNQETPTTAKSLSSSKKINSTIGKNSDSNKKKEIKPLLVSDSDTEENVSSNSKPIVCNELQDIDENSNSSDLPLSKFIPKKEQEAANNNAETKSKKKSTLDENSATVEENSCSDSPLPLPKSSGKQKKEFVPKTNIKRKSGLQSKSPKIQRKLDSSSDSDSDELVMNETSVTTNECQFPNSASKGSANGTKQSPASNRPGPASSKKMSSKKSQSTIKQSEDSKKKTSLKRKRSGESDSEQLQLSKIKRKLEISSDSEDSVNLDEKKSTRNENRCKSTDSSLNGCALDKSTKPSPTSNKNKLVSVSNKKKLPIDDGSKTTPTKKEPISDRKIGKLSEGKNKKLDDSDILQKLEDLSDQSDNSSEESEADEKPQEIEKKESTSSNSNKTSKEPKKSQNNNTKTVSEKKLKAVKKVISESESEMSDNATQTKGNNEPIEMESANSSSSSEDDSSSSNTKDKVKKKPENKSAKNDIQKESKKKIGDNPRILRLQRYLKEAGIRVQNYKTLWDGCKSDKARAEKLMDLLRERGLKGKPSVSECRKLKRKYEREKEISELNTSNIISTKGRSRRGAANPFASRRSPSPDNNTKEKQNYPECKQVFVRLRKIVDSEDSD